MVERIVAAGREVLATHGYDAFSTNRIAEVAGISPGSLYQYFTDKTAILDVIIDRYWEEVTERVVAALGERAGDTGRAMIRDTADALLSALESDRVLLRVLAEELPAGQNRTRRIVVERRVRELLALYLRANPQLSRRPDPVVTAWVVVLALENVALRWVLDEPAFERDIVLDEISALVAGYAGAWEPAELPSPRRSLDM
ncbi:TetR family transcriptional regulator [Aeromicrobium sp. PE09-221]|nr:TetR family transcriptional regulator [Aeromicrobium sp. PE09-221]